MSGRRLLDLFCGAGGAAMGYHRAGFDEIVGVDNRAQPAYPFTLVQADAIEYLEELGPDGLAAFDVIHASPPCQGYSKHTRPNSQWVHHHRGRSEPRLIATVREYLLELGRPYVIENVEGAEAELLAPLLLCGAMFDRPIRRHRLFEVEPMAARRAAVRWHPPCQARGRGGPGPAPAVDPYVASRTDPVLPAFTSEDEGLFGAIEERPMGWRLARRLGWEGRDMSVTGKGRGAGIDLRWKALMDMPWAKRQSDLTEAIPPAYTEWLGGHLLAAMEAAA